MIISFLVILFSLSVASETKLHFDENGEFNIAVFADIHYGGWILALCKDSKDKKTMQYIKSALSSRKIDLAVLDGDIINGYVFTKESSAQKNFNEAIQPFIDMQMPFAMTLGNHDWDAPLNKTKLVQTMNEYAYPYSLTQTSSLLHGVTNYALPIYSSADSSEVASVVYFLDSETDGCNADTRGCIREDQFQWLLDTAKGYSDKYGHVIPAVEFHHIPTSELLDWWSSPNTECRSAFKNEPICCSENPMNISSIVSQVGIMVTINGHDHTNLFECTKDNYTIAYNPKIGECSYGSPVGYRVITLRKTNGQKEDNRQLPQGFYKLKTDDRMNISVTTAIFNTENNPMTTEIVNYPRYSMDESCKKGGVKKKLEDEKKMKEIQSLSERERELLDEL